MKMSEAKNLDNDPRFNFGAPLIQTAEDATMAYLREQITEEEYKVACGKFGALPGQLVSKIDPVDAAFVRKVPDELREPDLKVPTVEERIKTANDNQKAREKASLEAAVAEVPDNGGT